MIQHTPKPRSVRARTMNDSLPSEVAPYFAALWQQITASQGTGPLAVGVTSALPREGVTTVAANLALCAAGETDQQVLLVEGNLRAPRLASLFHLQANPGLADLLRGDADLDTAVQATDHDRLAVVTAGSDVSATPWSISNLVRLLGELRERFPVVVFDLPPAQGLSPCLGVVDQLDGLLLVVEACRTSADEVRTVKKRLQAAQARVLGVVLNKLAEK